MDMIEEFTRVEAENNLNLKTPVTVMLAIPQHQRLKAFCATEKLSMTRAIQMAINVMLDAYEPPV